MYSNIAILCGDTDTARGCAERFVGKNKYRTASVYYIGDPSEPTEVGANPLKTTCRNHNVGLHAYVDEKTTLKAMKKLGVDMVICLWWPHILKKIHREIPMVINTHPSYLPYNRGKYPYYWAIMDRTPFGVTIHRINDGIDTGEIFWQREIDVTPMDTGEDLYRAADKRMGELFLEQMHRISHGDFPDPKRQDDSVATSHTSSELDLDAYLDLDEEEHVGSLIDDLRARTFLNHHSGRVVIIDGKRYRVHLRLVEDKSEEA